MSFPGQMHVTKAQVSWTWHPDCCCGRRNVLHVWLDCTAQLPWAPRLQGVEEWGLFLPLNEHNLADHAVGYKRLSSMTASGQGVLTFFHWTLTIAFCNMGKGARGLNSIGRRKGGWISELLHIGEQPNVTLVLMKEKVISEAWNANWDLYNSGKEKIAWKKLSFKDVPDFWR